VNLLQTWLILGIPLLAVSTYLFIGRNKTLARMGYVGLGIVIVCLLLVPQEAGQGRAISAGFVGAIAFVFVATGRGTHTDDEFREHHQDRKRYTVARDDEPSAPAP
jgi:hypothetical protein